jgi:hypothetical protein
MRLGHPVDKGKSCRDITFDMRDLWKFSSAFFALAAAFVNAAMLISVLPWEINLTRARTGRHPGVTKTKKHPKQDYHFG